MAITTTTGTAIFSNSSNDDLLLTRRSDKFNTTVRASDHGSVAVSVGDVFDITCPRRDDLRFRPLFINSAVGQTIAIPAGKIPLRSVASFSALRMLRCQPSLSGFDITKVKPRLLLDAFSPEQVFESIDADSISYDYSSPYYFPRGVHYGAVNKGDGLSSVKMHYSYNSFASEWSLNLGVGGKLPSGVGGKLDVGYNQFKNSERSSQNIYASSRDQWVSYKVDLDPAQAYLSPDFIAAVESVTSSDDALVNVVARFGTHIPRTVVYGGDRSVYMIMNESVFVQASGQGVSVKAEVSKSRETVTGSKEQVKTDNAGNATGSVFEQSMGKSEVASASLSFSHSSSSVLRDQQSNLTSGYQILGGGGFGTNWSVSDDNAVAVAVLESAYLDTLITPEVFKNTTTPEVLSQKREWIRQAIAKHIADLPTLGNPLPAPRIYSVTLSTLEVTEEVDDANKQTKGTVTATVTPSHPGFDGVLWNFTDYSEANLKYVKGQKTSPATKKTLFHPPTDEGTFDPVRVIVSGSIWEHDDDGRDELHSGTSTSLDLSDLEEGEKIDFSFDCNAFTTWAERGTIRVSGSVAREVSEFDNPRIANPLFDVNRQLVAGTPPLFQLFTTVGDVAGHPTTTLRVPKNYKIVSGGARVTHNVDGNLLTASYPQDGQTWQARAKDHLSASPAGIYVYAIAIYDPRDEWDVQIFNAVSSTANHPSTTVSAPAGYTVTGGGALANWSGEGQLLTASYPVSTAADVPSGWAASSKDHIRGEAGTVAAYVIGVKSRKAAPVPLSAKVFRRISDSANHPATAVAVGAGYSLVGGGASVSTTGAGNLLIASFPDGNSWKARSKDHVVASPAAVTACAIGLRTDVL